MIDVFKKGLTIVLQNEGGYAWVTGDSGGETYAGIARNYEPDWEGWEIIDRVKKERKVNRLKGNEKLAEITPDMLSAFYKKNYWDKVRGASIAQYNANLAIHVFDMAVNSGVRRAAIMLQELVEADPDGMIGSKTMEKLYNSTDGYITQKYVEARKSFYRVIAKGDKAKFLDGWLARVDHVERELKKLT